MVNAQTEGADRPPVLIKERVGDILIARMNRPERLNAFGGGLPEALAQAWLDFRDDPGLKVMILTGVGDRAFSAGADLRRNDERAREMGASAGSALLNEGSQVAVVADFRVNNIRLFKPVIAAINGWCLAGGCELAMGCDLRIAESHARLGLPEVKRGMGAKTTTHKLYFLTHLNAGLELEWTGDPIDAERAYALGLVNEVVPTGQGVERALEIARDICERSPRYLEYHKERMFQALGVPIEYGLAVEQRFAPHLSPGYREGLEASLREGVPGWGGH